MVSLDPFTLLDKCLIPSICKKGKRFSLWMYLYYCVSLRSVLVRQPVSPPNTSKPFQISLILVYTSIFSFFFVCLRVKIFVDDMVYRIIQVYSCALSHNCYGNYSLYRISAKHYSLLLTCWMCYSVFVDVLVR